MEKRADRECDITEVERSLPVDDIVYAGEPAWPIFRMEYGLSCNGKSTNTKREKPKISTTLLSCLYGMKNWLGRYRYIVISSSVSRREIDGEMYDIVADALIDTIGREDTLLIEKPKPNHFPRKRVHTLHPVSSRVVDMLSLILRSISPSPGRIDGEEVLDEIGRICGCSPNRISILKRFISDREVYETIFRIYRPRVLFVVSYYSCIPAIVAAKNLGIEVVEIQHGVIGGGHPAYNGKSIPDSYLPDTILTYGRRDMEFLEKSPLFGSVEKYPIGNWYIDRLSRSGPSTAERRDSRIRIGISLQRPIEDRTVEFIEEAASENEEIVYVLIPRDHRSFEYRPNGENIEISPEGICQESAIRYDLHATVYSTCAIEAMALGIPCIVIDIDGLGTKYLGELLPRRYSSFVSDPKVFVKEALRLSRMDTSPEDIARSASLNYLPGFYDNIKKFLEEKRWLRY
jgi:hypothetical protein